MSEELSMDELTRRLAALGVIRELAIAAVLIGVALPVKAQVAVGARYGQGEGSASYNVGEVNGRVRVVKSVYLVGSFEIIGGEWGCTESPIDAIRCGYDGNSTSAGIAVAVSDHRWYYIGARGLFGSFERTGTYGGRQYSGSRHATGAIGIDGELAILGPVRAQVGLTHRVVFDDLYKSTFDERPHLTALTVGVSLVVGRGNNGG